MFFDINQAGWISRTGERVGDRRGKVALPLDWTISKCCLETELHTGLARAGVIVPDRRYSLGIVKWLVCTTPENRR
jgi:hypothetical protein